MIEDSYTLYKTFQTAVVMTKSDPNTLTLSEFAAFISVHYMTARNYANAGLLSEFGAYRLPSGYWRIPRDGAERFKTGFSGSTKQHEKAVKKNHSKKTVKRPARKR